MYILHVHDKQSSKSDSSRIDKTTGKICRLLPDVEVRGNTGDIMVSWLLLTDRGATSAQTIRIFPNSTY